MMKTCKDCGNVKALAEFPTNNGKYLARCRPCKQVYDRNYYAIKGESLNKRRKVTRKVVSDELRMLVWTYLKEHPCLRCGEADPIVLEFDHRDRATKKYNVSDMVTGHYSKENVLLEIAKCDVLCANCHRRRTAEQFGWFTYES